MRRSAARKCRARETSTKSCRRSSTPGSLFRAPACETIAIDHRRVQPIIGRARNTAPFRFHDHRFTATFPLPDRPPRRYRVRRIDGVIPPEIVHPARSKKESPGAMRSSRPAIPTLPPCRWPPHTSPSRSVRTHRIRRELLRFVLRRGAPASHASTNADKYRRAPPQCLPLFGRVQLSTLRAVPLRLSVRPAAARSRSPVNIRNAASCPFHDFDCHIRNHSPPTLRNATDHCSRLSVKRDDRQVLRAPEMLPRSRSPLPFARRPTSTAPSSALPTR